jgi:hypothetical protein
MNDKTDMVRVPNAGELARQDFGGSSLEHRAETASTALAEQAKAAVQARYIMAMQRPRDLFQVREKLLADCKRPLFAEKAIYNKPIGKGVEGPSIRMAEAASRAMTNVFTDVFAVYDDSSKRIVRVCASDLEANVTYTKDVTVNKTIERRAQLEGRRILSQRINSKGDTTYTFEATDDEILDRENALASKAMRTCLLRLVPGDILEEAIAACYATMENKDAADPAAARKGMCDSFADMGVPVAALVEYLGHTIELTTAAEMKTLRGLFNALKDGETTWAQAIEAKGNKPSEKTPAPETKTAVKPQTLGDAAAQSRAKREGKAEPGSAG